MFNKMVNSLHLPRWVEIIGGVIMIIVLTSRYASHTQPQGKSLLAFITPYAPLCFVVTVFLFFVAARLIAGKPRDYSRAFYKLLVRLSGKRSVASGKME